MLEIERDCAKENAPHMLFQETGLKQGSVASKVLRITGRAGITPFPWEPGSQLVKDTFARSGVVSGGKFPTLVPLDNRSQLLASSGFHLVRTFNHA